MSRKTAMRVRLDLAMEMDPAGMEQVMAVSQKIEALKKAAADLGFVPTADVSAKLGTIDAPGENG